MQQLPLARVRDRRQGGLFKAINDAPPDLACVAHVLEEEGMLFHARRVEGLRIGTNSDDHFVVRERERILLRRSERLLQAFMGRKRAFNP